MGAAPVGRVGWWATVAISGLFLLAVGLQWNSYQMIAVADGVAYVTGGINLVRTGSFVGPWGRLEDWFPPLYPLLIGVFSLGGTLEPVGVGRVVAATASLAALLLTVWMLPGSSDRPSCEGVLAAAVLAANAQFQSSATSLMSEGLACALTLAGLGLYLRWPYDPRTTLRMATGACVGLAYLVRPEAIILLPAWMLIDLWTLTWKVTLRNMLVAGAASLVFVIPYVVYLHGLTGRWALTNKSQVTLAFSRAAYYGGSAFQVEPKTLELAYASFDVTSASELRRYSGNLARFPATLCGEILRCWLGGGVLIAAAWGAVVLARERGWRTLLGVLSLGTYLIVVAYYFVGARFMHGVLPSLAVLAGVGLAAWLRIARSWAQFPVRACLAALVLIWVLLGLAESASRWPRWVIVDGPGWKTLLRDAGMQLPTAGLPRGGMYEEGATLGYYAGQVRRRIPPIGSLAIWHAYLRRNEPFGRPIWLSLTTRELVAYPGVLREAFERDELPYPKVLTLADDRGRVVVYRLDEYLASVPP
jgi:hypothetical protein